MPVKHLEVLVVVNDELYDRGSGGVLTQAFSLLEAKEDCVGSTNLSRGENYIPLYRNL